MFGLRRCKGRKVAVVMHLEGRGEDEIRALVLLHVHVETAVSFDLLWKQRNASVSESIQQPKRKGGGTCLWQTA